MTTAPVSAVPDEAPVIPLPAATSALQAQRVYLIVLGTIVLACVVAIVILTLNPGDVNATGTRPEVISILGSLGSVCIGALAALARG